MSENGPGVRVDPALTDWVREHAGACPVLIAGATDKATARTYALAARSGLRRVRHPEEPDESAISFASPLVVTPEGTGFWFDASDVHAYDGLAERLVDAMAAGLRAIGADCRLTTVPAESFTEVAPAPCRLPTFRDDFPLPPSAEQVDRTGLGRISFVSRETVGELLAFLIPALEELGYPLGAVFEHDVPHPDWPALTVRLVGLRIQKDGELALTTFSAAGPLPDSVLAEVERMSGLVKVDVILDPIEPGEAEDNGDRCPPQS